MRRLLIVVVGAALVVMSLAVAPARSTEPAPLPHLHVEHQRIVDPLGRTVLLRGVNVNQLGDYFQANPDVPATLPFSRDDLEQIAALGMNTVRLLVHWSRLEPAPGVHDEAYLDRIRQAVAWAGELGLYVILDMHQDAWGRYVNTAPDATCVPPTGPAIGWDGAPEWATFTDGLDRCRLFLREASPAVAQAWQSFWLDRRLPADPAGAGIQQHFVDTWAWLAGEFRDDPTVAGYDLLNEPNPGFTLAATDATFLGELHRRAIEAIRAAEQAGSGGLRKIVFFEPIATWSATGVGVPRPFTLDDQIVFAPHIYLGSISADVAVTGTEVVPLRQGFEQARREAAVYGAPVWIGEWGHFGGDADYLRRFAALEDEFQVGSAFWQWKQACGDPHGMSWPDGAPPAQSGNLVLVACGDPAEPAGKVIGVDVEYARVLSRPYPRAFFGEAKFTSDPPAGTLDVAGTGGSAPLEVWVPGAAAPTVTTSGLGPVALTAVDGGWIVRAEPVAAEWTLRATAGT